MSKSRENNMKTKEWVDYVLSFYGPTGLNASFFKTPVTEAEILAATKLRVATGQFEGDSFDREAVRDIMLAARGQFLGR